MRKKPSNQAVQRKSGTPTDKQDVALQALHQQYSGPIPPPQILQQFDDIVPGSAERIIKMAENNNQHQIDIEKSAIQLASAETKRGQIFALIISALAFSTCIFALFLGSERTAMIVGGATIVGLATAFIVGRSYKN